MPKSGAAELYRGQQEYETEKNPDTDRRTGIVEAIPR